MEQEALKFWFSTMPEIKRFENTWNSKDVLEWLFCSLPKKEQNFLKWIIQLKLQHNLEQALKLECDYRLEELLRSFIRQNLDNYHNFATQHLQAYLFKIAVIKARKIHKKWQNKSWYESNFNLWDVFQEGFEIASKPTESWSKYDSKRGLASSYAFTPMESKIQDKVLHIAQLKDRERKVEKASGYYILYHATEKNLKQALKDFYYADFQFESRLLAGKCFKQVYVPVKGKKYQSPTKEQQEQIIELYLILYRTCELLSFNSQIDWMVMEQWLKDCIDALKAQYSVQRISLDAPLKKGEVITFIDQTPEEICNYEADATNINYYRAYYLDFQESGDLFHDLDENALLILYHAFELSMDTIAQLYQKNKSWVSRKINASNKEWLAEKFHRLGMSQAGEEFHTQKKLDADISQLVNEVRDKHFSFDINQVFLKVWEQLEPSSQKILELYTRQKFYKKDDFAESSLTTIEEDKIADVFQVLVRGILQWLDTELEISLPSCEPLTEKISDLADEFLIRIYQENVNYLNTQINSYRERLERLLDVDWVEPEKILVSSGRRRRANINQLSKEEQFSTPFIQLEKGKKIELDNQKFVLMIKIKQEKENEEMKLSFELLPSGETTTSLPSGLELALLKPSGKVMKKTTPAKIGDNQLVLALKISKATMWLEKLESNRTMGKLFQVQITVNGNSKTEAFPSIQPVTETIDCE